MRRVVSALPIAALLTCLFLTGCGGGAQGEGSGGNRPASPTGSSGTMTPSTSSDQQELRSAVQAYSDAYLTGDSQASRALLSKRCRDRFGEAEWDATVQEAKAEYGESLPIRSFHAQISGDLARVSYTFDSAEINQDSEPWVREDGSWHEDDC